MKNTMKNSPQFNTRLPEPMQQVVRVSAAIEKRPIQDVTLDAFRVLYGVKSEGLERRVAGYRKALATTDPDTLSAMSWRSPFLQPVEA